MAASHPPNGEGACVGKTKRGKGSKIMAIADRQGRPVAVHVESATPHEVTLVHATLAQRMSASPRTFAVCSTWPRSLFCGCVYEIASITRRVLCGLCGYPVSARSALLVLDAGHQRPDPRYVHLLNRHRLELGLREERGQVEIRLEADVNGGRRDAALDARDERTAAEEVIEDDDAAAGFADAAHLAGDSDRIGDDADHVRRVDD